MTVLKTCELTERGLRFGIELHCEFAATAVDLRKGSADCRRNVESKRRDGRRADLLSVAIAKLQRVALSALR